MRDQRLTLNLIHGVTLEIAHPELPTCADCHAWLYDTKTWQRTQWRGADLARPKGTMTPCHTCPKGKPDSRPHPEKELLAENRAALEWYYLCREDVAGRLVPRDLTTIRNNAIISRIIEQVDRNKMDLGPLLALAMLGGAGGKR